MQQSFIHLLNSMQYWVPSFGVSTGDALDKVPGRRAIDGVGQEVTLRNTCANNPTIILRMRKP